MKDDQCFVLTLFLFILGSFFGWFLAKQSIDISLTTVALVTSTLGAAFFGSWSSFLLQEKKDKRKEIDKEVGLANEIIVALGHQLNELLAFQHQFIDPHRDDEFRIIRIQPLAVPMKPSLKPNILNLSFLWQKGKIELLDLVSHVKQQFDLSISVINARSDLREEVKSAFEGIKYAEKTGVREGDIRAIMGERKFTELTQLTSEMIEIVDESIENHKKIIKDLHTELKELFPNHKVIYYKETEVS